MNQLLGANLDTRTEYEKQKDFHIKEAVASFAPVNWVEKSPTSWRKFPIQNQNGSGSCVAQTKKKLNGINVWLKIGRYITFSATHTYQRRANKPAPGMNGIDVFEIERSKGVTLEEFAPSEMLTDNTMDTMKIEGPALYVADIFLGGNHVGFTPGDIETIASTIQATGKGVMVWFYFTNQEWTDVPQIIVPNLDLLSSSTLRHSVAAVDFTLWQGKKALIIEDSWGIFGQFKGQRVITEDFFKARNWFARYQLAFKYEETAPTPTPGVGYKFTKPLQFVPLDSQGNITNIPFHEGQKADVKAMQDLLKKQGCMASNIASTGYYGSMTCKAVLAFQKKHGIDNTTSPEGKNVGPKTIAVLNKVQGL